MRRGVTAVACILAMLMSYVPAVNASADDENLRVLTVMNGQDCSDHRELFEPQNDVAQVTYPTPPPTPNPFATPTPFATATPFGMTPNPFATPTPFGATPSPQPSATFAPRGNSTTTLYATPPPQPGSTPAAGETPLPIPTATPNPFDQNQPVFVQRGGETPPPITPAGQAPPSPTPAPTDVPTLPPNHIAVLADKVSGNTSQGQPGDADGNVHILYGAEEIVGDHAHFDGLRTITITGNPFIINRAQDSVLEADEIAFDTIDQTAKLTNGRGTSSEGVERGLVHFKAKDLHTDQDGIGHGLAPNVSTCMNSRSGYHITGKNMDVYPGDKIVIYKAILWLGAAAIFWLPKVVIPLRTVQNEAQRPRYFPDIGYDQYEGYWIKTRITFGKNQYYYGYYTVNYYTKVGLGLGYTGYYTSHSGHRSASLSFYTIKDARIDSRQNNIALNELENFSNSLKGNFGLTYVSNFGPYTNVPANEGFTANVAHTGLRSNQTYGFDYSAVGNQSNSTSYSFTDSRQFTQSLRNSLNFNLAASSSDYAGFATSNSTAHFNDLADYTTAGADYQMNIDRTYAAQPYGVNKLPEFTIRPYKFFPDFKYFPMNANFVIGEYSEPSNDFSSQRADIGLNMGPLIAKVANSDFQATVNVNQYAYGTGDLKASIQQNMSLNTPLGTHFVNSITYDESNYNGPAFEPFQFLDQQPTTNSKAAQDLVRVFNGNYYNLSLGFSTYFNEQAQPVTYQFMAAPSSRSVLLLSGSFNPGAGNGFYTTNAQIAFPLGPNTAAQFVTDIDWKQKGALTNKVLYLTKTIGGCYQIQALYNESLKLVTVSLNILAFPSQTATFSVGQSGPLIPTTFNF